MGPLAAATLLCGYSVLAIAYFAIRPTRYWTGRFVDLQDSSRCIVRTKEVRARMEEGAARREEDYWASPLEQEWASSPHAGELCATAIRQASEAHVHLWLSYAEAAFHPQGRPVRAPNLTEAEALSYFVDQKGQNRYIEPLSGIARHPLAARFLCQQPASGYVGPNQGTMDISYLITDNYCDGQRPKPRVKLFDLGCSVFGNRSYMDEYTMGSGQGPSIPLFYGMFRDRCLEPDEIFAWEAHEMSGKKWWKEVPVDIRVKLRFYNTPIEECTSESSFLRMLPLAVKQEDYVILKVDIDGGPELEIVEAIAAQPGLSALVDELFFEYHFYFDGMDFGWGTSVVPGTSVDSAIGLMTRLRHAGIRSHFWV